MSNSFYPLADVNFIIEKLLKSKKVNPDTYLKVGNTNTVLLKGDKALHKKIVLVREIDGQVNFMQATALAALHGFMGDLLIGLKRKKIGKKVHTLKRIS